MKPEKIFIGLVAGTGWVAFRSDQYDGGECHIDLPKLASDLGYAKCDGEFATIEEAEREAAKR